MQISEVIENIKKYHQGYTLIDPDTSRDQILWGNPDQKCTGIVVCIYPSIKIIQQAIKHKANLIVSHEGMFWNHGDHTDWLEGKNNIFEQKIALLNEGNICVWRDHDHIHSGIPISEEQYVDGIFYGFAHEAGWKDYLLPDSNGLSFKIPKTTVKEVGKHLLEKFHLNGMKVIGNLDQPVEKIDILFHVTKDAKQEIQSCEKRKRDLMICMELVDFTLTTYVKDASQLNKQSAILCMGHFNTEEPGMRYCLQYFPEAIGEEIPMWFISMNDMYQYLTKQG